MDTTERSPLAIGLPLFGTAPFLGDDDAAGWVAGGGGPSVGPVATVLAVGVEP